MLTPYVSCPESCWAARAQWARTVRRSALEARLLLMVTSSDDRRGMTAAFSRNKDEQYTLHGGAQGVAIVHMEAPTRHPRSSDPSNDAIEPKHHLQSAASSGLPSGLSSE